MSPRKQTEHERVREHGVREQALREPAVNAKDFPKMDETSARHLNEGLARVGAEIEFGRCAAGA